MHLAIGPDVIPISRLLPSLKSINDLPVNAQNHSDVTLAESGRSLESKRQQAPLPRLSIEQWESRFNPRASKRSVDGTGRSTSSGAHEPCERLVQRYPHHNGGSALLPVRNRFIPKRPLTMRHRTQKDDIACLILTIAVDNTLLRTPQPLGRCLIENTSLPKLLSTAASNPRAARDGSALPLSATATCSEKKLS